MTHPRGSKVGQRPSRWSWTLAASGCDAAPSAPRGAERAVSGGSAAWDALPPARCPAPGRALRCAPMAWPRALQTTPCPRVSCSAPSRALTPLACCGEPFQRKVSSSQESTTNPATGRICDVSYGNTLFLSFSFFFSPLKLLKSVKLKRNFAGNKNSLL